MNNKIFIITLSLFSILLVTNFSWDKKHQEKNKEKITNQKEKKGVTVVKADTTRVKEKQDIKVADTSKTEENLKFKLYKKQAHASYYHDRFNGRKTASGIRFDNNKNSAAHKKLPFGTLVKVTNEANGKSVIVQVTDRGPYSRAREIDLSKKAFMEITGNKNSGVVIVTLEVVDK